MCWVTKDEFFKYFPSIFVSAFNTARLKDPDYVNDLEDEFPRSQNNHGDDEYAVTAGIGGTKGTEAPVVTASSSIDTEDNDDDEEWAEGPAGYKGTRVELENENQVEMMKRRFMNGGASKDPVKGGNRASVTNDNQVELMKKRFGNK